MSHFNVAGLKEQLLELHETMNEPDFWNDLKRSTEVSRKVRITENKVEHYEKLCQRADDVDTTMELAEEMQDTDLLAEAGEEIKKLQSDLEELRLESLLRGDYDSNNCYLSLHAGAGGTEAQDWTLMLYRMYTRYCERHGFMPRNRSPPMRVFRTTRPALSSVTVPTRAASLPQGNVFMTSRAFSA